MTTETHTQHTPGPWSYEPDHSTHNLGGFLVTTTGGRFDLLEVPRSTPPTGGTAKANARLIASAPDLLAALEALMSDPEVTTVCAPEAWERADTAIAKAKGE